MNIVLGTVQFGLDYGITNKLGKVNFSEICSILKYAHAEGITTLDTATQYGEAECVIGQASKEIGLNFNIITKTRKFAGISKHEQLGYLISDCEQSLKNVKAEKLYALLFHHAGDLLGDNGEQLYAKIMELQKDGLVEKIGVSVYTPEELKQIIDRYVIDIVQLPLNIFDQRFVPLMSDLKEKNIEVHARSIFLQGLLLNWKTLSEKLIKFENYFNAYEMWLLENKLTPMQAAVMFAKKNSSHMVFGVTSQRELEQIIITSHTNLNSEIYFESAVAQELIDPRLWNS